MPSTKKIGFSAEKISRKNWKAKGYKVDFKVWSQFHGKDLLSTKERKGFDLIAYKPNSYPVLIQVKSSKKVSIDLLKNYVQWQADFTVDSIPCMLVVLDVWEWVKTPNGKEMKMESWDLIRMMSELGKREELESSRKIAESAQEAAKVAEENMAVKVVEDIAVMEKIS